MHIAKIETLKEAYRIAKRNGGAPGIDGQTFEDIEAAGLASFLEEVREELMSGRYQPKPNRLVDIPKDGGKVRTLQIPCIRDRVVQGALKLILEAIKERGLLPEFLTGIDPGGLRTARWRKSGAVCCGGCPL